MCLFPYNVLQCCFDTKFSKSDKGTKSDHFQINSGSCKDFLVSQICTFIIFCFPSLGLFLFLPRIGDKLQRDCATANTVSLKRQPILCWSMSPALLSYRFCSDSARCGDSDGGSDWGRVSQHRSLNRFVSDKRSRPTFHPTLDSHIVAPSPPDLLPKTHQVAPLGSEFSCLSPSWKEIRTTLVKTNMMFLAPLFFK